MRTGIVVLDVDGVIYREFYLTRIATDLPPGHPMLTGQQTVEFDLSAVEQAKTVVVWGMNWITTKMPDAHWLTEARLKGTRIVVIACEYSATATKADEVLGVRPGTTPVLALGWLRW